MGLPKGYKLKESTKDTVIRARLNERDMEKLDFVAEKTNDTYSTIVRNGIDIQYRQLGGVADGIKDE